MPVTGEFSPPGAVGRSTSVRGELDFRFRDEPPVKSCAKRLSERRMRSTLRQQGPTIRGCTSRIGSEWGGRRTQCGISDPIAEAL